MIIELGNISYLFQIPLKWFRSVTDSINGMYGDAGVKVEKDGEKIRIRLGSEFFDYRNIDCVRPTFDVDGNVTGLDFYKVRAFCEFTKDVQSINVPVEEC